MHGYEVSDAVNSAKFDTYRKIEEMIVQHLNRDHGMARSTIAKELNIPPQRVREALRSLDLRKQGGM